MPFAGIRPPAVSGSFYPANPSLLETEVSTFLEEGQGRVPSNLVPRAVIAPHAGYLYSGPVAGTSFASLGSGEWSRVVILGPSHRFPLEGVALASHRHFATPLGDLPLDLEAAEAILGLPQVEIEDRAHRYEHSLEVEFPFLQSLHSVGAVLPLVVGRLTPESLEQVLDRVWSEETLVVVSTDLSHFLPYEEALRVDRATVDKITSFSPTLRPDEACGASALNGFLLAARARGLEAELLDLRNSGDTAGSRDRVVGYGAMAFHGGPGC